MAGGSSATLTAEKAPEHSEYIPVTVTYTSPKGKKCSDRKYIWYCRCYTKISGPESYTIGDPPIQLTASGDPAGGTFEWTPSDGLTPDGSSAQFMIDTPEEISLMVSYTPPGETAPCDDTHKVEVIEACQISINGPDTVNVGHTVTLSAQGSPEGGTYFWPSIPELVNNGQTADFTGVTPGQYIIEVSYRPDDGGAPCTSDPFTITVRQCNIEITGPHETKTGETINLEAIVNSGEIGGTFLWGEAPGLTPNGSKARFTGQYAGKINIHVHYSPPGQEKPCGRADHNIEITEECFVVLEGPSEIELGDTAEFKAFGSGKSGTYIWYGPDNLIANHDTAQFTGLIPGNKMIKVLYVPDSDIGVHAIGKKITGLAEAAPTDDIEQCSASKNVMVNNFKVISIDCDHCVNSGTTMNLGDFIIITDPGGFDDEVVIDPLYFSTLSSTETVTITAANSEEDPTSAATTDIVVVNRNHKETHIVSFEIPNYVSTPLEKIGIAGAVDLKIGADFTKFFECCNTFFGRSTSGRCSISLYVSSQPFTVIGIVVPPPFKKYISVDALNITLCSKGNVSLSGNYEICKDITDWDTTGTSLVADVKVAATVKAKFPKVVITQGKISGSTNIAEKLEIDNDSTTLKIKTDWGGLTAAGSIEFKVPILKLDLTWKAEKNIWKAKSLPSVSVDLPSLK